MGIILRSTGGLIAYFRGILSGLAAIIFADLVTGLWLVLRFTKATGMAAVAGCLLEAVYSPVFWILAILLFAVFFAASRSRNEVLRLVFFWFPTVTTSCVGVIIASFFVYLFIHFWSH